MPNVEYVINRVPLGKKQTDIEPKFPKLMNLFLDYMENKKKLKPGLPNLKDTPENTQFDTRKPNIDDNPDLFWKDVKKPSSKPVSEGTALSDSEAAGEDDFMEDSEDVSESDDEDESADFDDEFNDSDDDEDDDTENGDDSDNEVGDDDSDVGDDSEEPKSKNKSKSSKQPSEPVKVNTIDKEMDDDEKIVNDLYGHLPESEKELKIKEHYLYSFKKIKKVNPSIEIPDVDEHDDLTDIKIKYRRVVKDIALDKSISDNRMYLVVGFMAIEKIGIDYLDIDIKGYTKMQLRMMDRYNELLIELGERSYNRWGTNFPVEIRLIFLMLINAFLFFLMKMLMSKREKGSGDSDDDLIIMVVQNMMNGGKPMTDPKTAATGGDGTTKPKPKMKPPTINLDNIGEDDGEDDGETD